MKFLFTALIYLLLISNSKAQWFWQNSSNQNSDLINIDFVDSSHGWIVGHDRLDTKGVLYKTTNGGANWEKQLHSDFWGLSSVKFIDSSIGYAVGQNNPDTALSYGEFVYKSTNGGRDWFKKLTGTDKGLWAVDFTDSNIGWAVGWTIIKTTNGGTSWETQFSDTAIFLFNSVDFIDSVIGWVVGYSDKILKTTDGGSNWFYQRNKFGRILSSVKFIDENIGWTVGDSGRIFRTTDGGTNWLIQRDGTHDKLISVSFVDVNNGWVAGFKTDGPVNEYLLLKTTNGGLIWEEQFLPGNLPIFVVHFVNQNTGWVAGYNGAILKTTTGGVIPVELISINASVNGNAVELKWSTASETNNKGFEIEKSETSKVKSQKWNKIGFVEGYGTTSESKSYSYSDKNLQPGNYSYRLKQIDFDGKYEYSDEIEVVLNVPDKFALYQNYPNPFNPKTKIKFTIPNVETRHASSLLVTLKIYNLLGKEVATLVNEVKSAGVYEVEFDGNSLSSGVYFYRLESGSFTETKKLMLLK